MSARPTVAASFFAGNATPRALFITGAVLFPAFLLQQDIVLRVTLFGLFLCLNALSGRRIRIVQYLAVSAGIIAFNLVIPTGRVLATVIGLPLTEGALKSGLYKASAMIGLIALSQFSIRANLRLPGRLGGLIGTSLLYFERIMGEKRTIDRKDVVGSIDAILLSVHADPPVGESGVSLARTSPWGAMALAIVMLGSWGIFGWTLLHPHPFWGG